MRDTGEKRGRKLGGWSWETNGRALKDRVDKEKGQNLFPFAPGCPRSTSFELFSLRYPKKKEQKRKKKRKRKKLVHCCYYSNFLLHIQQRILHPEIAGTFPKISQEIGMQVISSGQNK